MLQTWQLCFGPSNLGWCSAGFKSTNPCESNPSTLSFAFSSAKSDESAVTFGDWISCCLSSTVKMSCLVLFFRFLNISFANFQSHRCQLESTLQIEPAEPVLGWSAVTIRKLLTGNYVTGSTRKTIQRRQSRKSKDSIKEADKERLINIRKLTSRCISSDFIIRCCLYILALKWWYTEKKIRSICSSDVGYNIDRSVRTWPFPRSGLPCQYTYHPMIQTPKTTHVLKTTLCPQNNPIANSVILRWSEVARPHSLLASPRTVWKSDYISACMTGDWYHQII